MALPFPLSVCTNTFIFNSADLSNHSIEFQRRAIFYIHFGHVGF